MPDGVVVRDLSGRPIMTANDGEVFRLVRLSTGAPRVEAWDGSAWVLRPDGAIKTLGDGVWATDEMLAALGVPVEDSTPPVR